MHAFAQGYPIDPDAFDRERGSAAGSTRMHYKTFFTCIGRVLPCRYCRDSYMAFAERLPIDSYLGSRASLVEWVYRIHGMVNDKLGVVYSGVTLKGVYDRYESLRASCHPSKTVLNGCTTPMRGYRKMYSSVVVGPRSGAARIVPSYIMIVAVFVAGMLIQRRIGRPGRFG
jgi:hypothetical protein